MGNAKEYILYGVKKGEPDYMEEVICVDPSGPYFAAATKWAIENGYDRFRESVVDLGVPPEFTSCLSVR